MGRTARSRDATCTDAHGALAALPAGDDGTALPRRPSSRTGSTRRGPCARRDVGARRAGGRRPHPALPAIAPTRRSAPRRSRRSTRRRSAARARADRAARRGRRRRQRRDPTAALERLIQDDDPWIAGLSGRPCTLTTDGRGDDDDRRPLVDRARDDALLRRVPLFGGLDPEDLQRVAIGRRRATLRGGRRRSCARARSATSWSSSSRARPRRPRDRRRRRSASSGRTAGRAHRRAGGAARAAARGDGGGRRRRCRGPGHRRRGLTAILRERPEAAMAMLATLAERISQAVSPPWSTR